MTKATNRAPARAETAGPADTAGPTDTADTLPADTADTAPVGAPQAAPTEAAAPAVATVRALRVVCATEGFRRAGFAFGAQPVDLPLASLSPAQERALRTEPRLAVLEVDVPA